MRQDAQPEVLVDLTNPIQSVIPSAHGAILSVLARTDEPLSGRRIAELTRPRFAQTQVNRVLRRLAASGVVLLDIIVCEHCYVEARDLGLHTEKIGVRTSSRARKHSSSRKSPASGR